MAQQTPTTGAVFIDERWARDVQMERDNALVAAKVVDHQYEDAILESGDTVHIASIANFDADAITPGTALTPYAPTETEQTLLIDKYYGKAVSINDMLRFQSRYDLQAKYANRIGEAVARQIDTTIMERWTDADAAHMQTAVAALTYDGLVDAVTLLDEDNVPQEDRNLLVNAVSMGDLRKLDEFTRYDATGQISPAVSKGPKNMVGLIYGIPVWLTNQVVTVAGTVNDYKNILLHKSAIALAIQKKMNIETERDALAQATHVVGSSIWGVKTVRSDHMVVVTRDS